MNIAVKLPTAIIYVVGTVNGVERTFDRLGDVWQAVADKSADAKYEIALSAWDSAGNVSKYNVTMYYSIHLITDRTKADVDEVKRIANKIKRGTATKEEINEYLACMRGSYNADDMNRVEGAVKSISDRLTAAGYAAPDAANIIWKMADIPSPVQRAEYINRVTGVRNAFYIFSDTPELPPDMEHLDYVQANAIEQNLIDIWQLIENMTAEYRYSGELYSGEG